MDKLYYQDAKFHLIKGNLWHFSSVSFNDFELGVNDFIKAYLDILFESFRRDQQREMDSVSSIDDKKYFEYKISIVEELINKAKEI